MDTEYISRAESMLRNRSNTNWTPCFVFIFKRKNMKLGRDREVGEEELGGAEGGKGKIKKEIKTLLKMNTEKWIKW